MTWTQKAVVFVAGLAGFVATAMTIALLWGWFVAPLGVPPITTVHAAGLMALYDVAVHRTETKRAEPLFSLTVDEAAARLGQHFAVVITALLTGFFIKDAM